MQYKIAFATPSSSRFYRIQLDCGRLLQWQIGELTFLRNNQQVHLGGPYEFSSAWMSAGAGDEWVYVDLGVKSRFDRVALAWIFRPAEGAVQVSDDAASWKTVHPLDGVDIKDRRAYV